MEEIIFDTLQQNTKKLKRFELQMIAKHIKLIIKIRQQGKGEKGRKKNVLGGKNSKNLIAGGCLLGTQG